MDEQTNEHVTSLAPVGAKKQLSPTVNMHTKFVTPG